jgi:hypothetical protein
MLPNWSSRSAFVDRGMHSFEIPRLAGATLDRFLGVTLAMAPRANERGVRKLDDQAKSS